MTCGGSAGLFTKMSLTNTIQKNITYAHMYTNITTLSFYQFNANAVKHLICGYVEFECIVYVYSVKDYIYCQTAHIWLQTSLSTIQTSINTGTTGVTLLCALNGQNIVLEVLIHSLT